MPYVTIIHKPETDAEALERAVINGARKARKVYIAYVDHADLLEHEVMESTNVFEFESFKSEDALRFKNVRLVGVEGESYKREQPFTGTFTWTLDALLEEAKAQCVYHGRINSKIRRRMV